MYMQRYIAIEDLYGSKLQIFVFVEKKMQRNLQNDVYLGRIVLINVQSDDFCICFIYFDQSRSSKMFFIA